MIATLSGYVPWWGAVLIALIAAASGPLAVQLESRHRKRSRNDVLKHAAYLKLIAASEILAFRSTVFGAQRSARNSFAETLSDTKKAILVLFLGAFVDRFSKRGTETLRVFADAIPTPTPIPDSMDATLLQAAYEDLVKSNIEVSLYGSMRSVDASEKLLDDAKSFFKLIEKSNWTWSGLPSKDVLIESRNTMLLSTSAFVKIARSELKIKEPKL